MDIISGMNQEDLLRDVVTHEILYESPIGVDSNGIKGRKIKRYLTTIMTPNNKRPVYWVNTIERLWLPENDSHPRHSEADA